MLVSVKRKTEGERNDNTLRGKGEAAKEAIRQIVGSAKTIDSPNCRLAKLQTRQIAGPAKQCRSSQVGRCT
ncbi:hypothetical protein POVWA2_021130 [Plasmodium ovale wallikeri]|uniref:Uncharacterized protein n=1 Tax=Plasmodium ovale wallikeri TaxID=864142 RepID=A0A1A8YRH0_PLAOA|nr:hypothetical protein POVWA1_021150 [Plasmodium ovale wallikeri]SBT34691.1 hypothetical protein POVWA2_021130 [Plasmodium ovale wallikeri]